MIRTFQTDLELGKEAEGKVLDTIQKKYPLAFGIEGKHKAYDIFIPELDVGVEVKHDLQTSTTGNIMIEISCNGQPSGLMATRAKMWAYCFDYETLWLDTSRVKDMIIEHNPELRRFTPKDETCTVKAYLVPLDVARGYCQ